MCVGIAVFVFFYKTNNTVSSKNELDIKASPEIKEIANRDIIQQDEVYPFLNLIKKPFDPNLIGFYTGLSTVAYTRLGVQDFIFVQGIHEQSGKQVLMIYSKNETSKIQNIRVKIENNTLIIFIAEKNNTNDSEKNRVYQIETSEAPVQLEVFRNCELKSKMKIHYQNETATTKYLKSNPVTTIDPSGESRKITY